MHKFGLLKKMVWAMSAVAAACIFALATAMVFFPPAPADVSFPEGNGPSTGTGRPNRVTAFSGPDTTTIVSYRQPALPGAAVNTAKNDVAEGLSNYVTLVGITNDVSKPASSCVVIGLKKKNNEQIMVYQDETFDAGGGMTGVKLTDVKNEYAEFTVNGKKQIVELGIVDNDPNTTIPVTGLPVNSKKGGQTNKGKPDPGVKGGVPNQPKNPIPPPEPANTMEPQDNLPPTGVEADKFNTTQDPNDPNKYDVDPDEKEWMTANEERIGKEISAVPYKLTSDGIACDGFIINKITPGSLLEKRGLKQGDIIKSINGKPIKTTAEAKKMLKDPTIRSSNTITVEIERAGKSIIKTYATKK